MLVRKKQEWDIYQDSTIPSAAKPLSKPNNKLRFRCLKFFCLAVIIAMITLIQSEMIIRSGYSLVQTKIQMTQLEKDNEQLRLKIAKLKSPQRIQQISIDELGMVLPKNIYYATGINQPDTRTNNEDTTILGRELNLVTNNDEARKKPH
jgi:cell division protein FtsL